MERGVTWSESVRTQQVCKMLPEREREREAQKLPYLFSERRKHGWREFQFLFFMIFLSSYDEKYNASTW